jgi:heptose I phosphotransferase
VIRAIREIMGRLRRGQSWAWRSAEFRAWLPDDLDACVMRIESADRLHKKQGRSTCRVKLDSPHGPLSVYLKRHEQLPLGERVAGLIDFDGRHTPAGAEWRHLEYARSLGVPVPPVVAAGEMAGPWGRLQSYLMIQELTGQEALHEAIPVVARTLPPAEFERWKRRVAVEVARVSARLHRARAFHKDLYLCHFFAEASDPGRPGTDLTLIDLHRLGRHRWTAPWWRWKDLGQLLYSTVGVEGLTRRDILRFWSVYRREMGLRLPRLDARLARFRAARYLSHNHPGASLDAPGPLPSRPISTA